MSASTPGDLLNLSNDDVKLLYEIIHDAEKSHLAPFRALFTAYEQVLQRYGISRESDQVYLRFLLRMGEDKKQGITLYGQFENLLAKFGIQVSFEDEDAPLQEGFPVATDSTEASLQRLETIPFRPARRASFESSVHSPGTTHRRDDYHYPRSRSAETIRRTRIIPKKPTGQSNTAAQREPSAIARIQKPLHRQDQISYLQRNLPDDESSADGDSISLDLVRRTELLKRGTLFPPRKVALDRALDQSEIHAKTLRFHHLAANAVILFRQWRDAAEELQRQRAVMMQTASTIRTTSLMKLAFSQWKIAVAEEDMVRETERFYTKLEQRAGKARDLFITTKALTHWAQCTAEALDRNDAAKRNILRARIFQAWRDVTVVNEFKVRQHRLSRSMAIWKSRTGRVLSQKDEGIHFDTLHRLNNSYRIWFWLFCDRRAPIWYSGKVRNALFLKWSNRLRNQLLQRECAIDYHALDVVRKSLFAWTSRQQTTRDATAGAGRFRRTFLLRNASNSLRLQCKLSSMSRVIELKVQTNFVRSFLQRWVAKARSIDQARIFDHDRSMKMAWTPWNDALRTKVLARTINDRTVSNALYKWILAERLALGTRFYHARLMASTFREWHKITDHLCERLDEAKQLLTSVREERAKAEVIEIWSSLTLVEVKSDLQAQSFLDQRLMTYAFKEWLARYNKFTSDASEAQDARFYCLTNNSLKNWRIRTLDRKKSRRRDAYAAVRRKIKSNLARQVVRIWQHKTTNHTSIKQLAVVTVNAYEQQILSMTVSQWRAQADSRLKATYDSQKHLRISLLTKNAISLVSAFRNVQFLNIQAREFCTDSLYSSASNCLRRLSWNAFQVTRLREGADSLELRLHLKHQRAMLRHWSEKVVTRRATKYAGPATDPAEANPTWLRTPVPRSVLFQERTGTRSNLSAKHLVLPTPHQALLTENVQNERRQPSTPAYLRTPSRYGSGHRMIRDPTLRKLIDAGEPIELSMTSPAPASRLGSPLINVGAAFDALEQMALDNSASPDIRRATVQPQTPATRPLGRLYPERSGLSSAPLRTAMTPFLHRLRGTYPREQQGTITSRTPSTLAQEVVVESGNVIGNDGDVVEHGK